MVRLIIPFVTVFPVLAGATNTRNAVKTKSLRLQFFLKFTFMIGGACFQKILGGMQGAIRSVAERVRSANGVNILPLRRCRLLRNGGRRYQQRQGDDEMFHENSLEAISGNVKRAA